MLVNGESVDFDPPNRPRHGDWITAYPVFETLAIRAEPQPPLYWWEV